MASKRVHLTATSLREFTQAVQSDTSVQELTLVGIHDDDGQRPLDEAPAAREELIDLLAQAFTVLVESGVKPLTLLNLRIDIGGAGRRPIPKTELEARSTSRSAWQCSNDTFFIAIQALAASKLQIQGLNVFNDLDMKLFALASDQFNIVDWDSPDVGHALADLKSLSVNISTPVFAFRKRKTQKGAADWLGRVTEWTAPQVRAEAEKESTFNGLARLVQKCPQLKHFEYRWLGIPLPQLPDLQGFKFPGWKILHLVTQLPNLPTLKRCTLRHHITRGPDVLELLERTKPAELFIGPMWLDPGKFKPIFDYCTSKEANMEKLGFRGPLYQLGRPDLGQVHFQRQEYDEDAECSAHLMREGDAIRRPIYHHMDTQGFVRPGSTYCDVVGEGKANTF
ncbi:hypothetical protein FSARC_9371 [Fusarium sarcochroum]|uniref:Uncharacterized protein n=1 Tax=Fusarium sarcochroum TaxID=1208366 RepID=A0A8H4TR29_9HYPO|nr:hypothetical protein FSARC_9371 [Fusarium sarcochroum]